MTFVEGDLPDDRPSAERKVEQQAEDDRKRGNALLWAIRDMNRRGHFPSKTAVCSNAEVKQRVGAKKTKINDLLNGLISEARIVLEAAPKGTRGGGQVLKAVSGEDAGDG